MMAKKKRQEMNGANQSGNPLLPMAIDSQMTSSINWSRQNKTKNSYLPYVKVKLFRLLARSRAV